MEVSVEKRGSGATCYRCQRETDAMVCHHCGRPICAECGPAPIPEAYFFERIENVEFDGLDVEKHTPEGAAVHCRFDVHAARSLNEQFLTWLGGSFLFVTVVLALVAATVSAWVVPHMLLASVIAVFFFYGVSLERERWQEDVQRQRPLVPILGQNVMIRVHEKVRGRAHLDAGGRYELFSESARGEIAFDLQFTNDDLNRWERYKRNYPQANAGNSALHAGFVFLRGANRLQFEDQEEPVYQNHLALRERLADHAFFVDGSDREWQPTRSYTFPLQKEGDSSGLPVHVFPALIGEGDTLWGIQFTVQLNPRVHAPSLSNPRVKSLELSVPPELGDAVSKTPYAYLASGADDEPSAPDDESKLTWQGIPLEADDGRGPEAAFYVRFSNSDTVKPEQTVRGRLCVVFDGALSGLEETWRFSPFGYRVKERPDVLRRQTEVEVEFEFDLTALTLRRTVGETESTEKLEGILDSETIRKLVEAFSGGEVYVQRVIENVPQPNRADAKVINRLWVIAGRRYKKVSPIDFRVVVIGKARYADKDVPEDGEIRCDLMTQGVVTDDNMRKEIEEFRRDLLEIIQKAFS